MMVELIRNLIRCETAESPGTENRHKETSLLLKFSI